MEYDAPFDPDEHGAEPIQAEPIPEFDDSSPDEYSTGYENSPVHGDDHPKDREGMSPLTMGLLIVVVLALAAGAWWWMSRNGADPADGESVATQQDEGARPGGEANQPEPTEPAEPEIELPRLSASDAFVRETAARLSEHPALVRWLANDDLVRRYVATVENVANGASPSSHLEFMEPNGPFEARRTNGELKQTPASYERYDLAVDVFTSLDIGTAVQLFHTMEPLLDEAYREIAPPGASFRDALSQAIDRLLEVEVPEQSPELEEAVLSYRYADPDLEELTPAEKHLLRLGPERAARVQTKLQFLQAGLDLDSQSSQQ